ncbi:MAG TPA: hypothetical protein VFS41_09900 [Edaphobacter sp.]|nr:hypothetical protein [Edaphobacter sp.]
MLFSDHFNLDPNSEDWFNTILDADTQLFVDPFLLFRETSPEWSGTHSKIISHFNKVFSLIAENINPVSLSYRKALHLLTFREPHELCLGYTSSGSRGAGGGMGYAHSIASAIVDAINRGLVEPEHFEELGVLNEGIGSDRISDITCTIIKTDLIRYTQNVCRKHDIAMSLQRVYATGIDEQRIRWKEEEVELPSNPYKDGPLLLIPRRFLRELPTLNADDWWTFYENEMLRTDVNYELMGRVDKKTIIETARKNVASVRGWTVERETVPSDSYDFANDPQGVHKWDETTRDFANAHPLTMPPAHDCESFFAVIENVITQFKLFVEEQGGWSLLWARTGKDKPEQAAQLLFRGIAQNYCRANNISLDAEVNLGRGPVDFKFSTGYLKRAHLEVKKLHNGRFWNGLEEQLPSYMKSDEVRDGWFLAIRYKDGEAAEKRINEISPRLSSVAKQRHVDLRFSLIDARPKESASKL